MCAQRGAGCAKRELEEETGLTNVFMEQLYTFGDMGRDPRGRTISVAYYALLKLADYKVQPGSDASHAQWFNISEVPELAFDHAKILQTALDRLKGKVRYQPIGFRAAARKIHAVGVATPLRSGAGCTPRQAELPEEILRMDLLVELEEWQAGVPHRAARLYRFDRQRYRELKSHGFNFEV
jgi:8-oxo-dGTP diphosphatase